VSWTNYQKAGPCYSNVSLIKKALFQSKYGRLPYHEIILYFKKHWQGRITSTKNIEELVNLALYAPKSFFVEGDSELWSLKYEEDPVLNPVYKYAKSIHRPFKLKEVVKLLNVSDYEYIFQQDIRFTSVESTDFWLLSEWELINNLVYEFMQQRDISSAKKDEILKQVVEEYKLGNHCIFAPELDSRFIKINNTIKIELQNQEDNKEKVEVPVEVKEEVARSSIKIYNYIINSSQEIKVKDLIPDLFKVMAHDPSFSLYYETIEELLSSFSDIVSIGKGRWVSKNNIPQLGHEDIDKKVHYGVYNSKPIINNADELLEANTHVSNFKSNGQKAITSNLTGIQQSPSKITYLTISYYERIKGYLFPSNMMTYISLSNKKIGRVEVSVEGSSYGWMLGLKDNKFYFYGDQVFDFFSDFLLEPGHELKLEVVSEGNLKLDLVGFNERYAYEQSRYLDIGRLVEESKSVNKSIFTIMCEVLSTYPSGMHWTELLDKVNDIRFTTKNTVYNLLSRNECFVSLDDKKGYWRLNLSKLSRYYVNEENQQVEQSEQDNEIDTDFTSDNEHHHFFISPEETQLPLVLEDPVNQVHFLNETIPEKQSKVHNEEGEEDITEQNQSIHTKEIIITIIREMRKLSNFEARYKEKVSNLVKEFFKVDDISKIEELHHDTTYVLNVMVDINRFIDKWTRIISKSGTIHLVNDPLEFNEDINQCISSIEESINKVKDRQKIIEQELIDIVKYTNLTPEERIEAFSSLVEEQELNKEFDKGIIQVVHMISKISETSYKWFGR
jgi:hypothetical protein